MTEENTQPQEQTEFTATDAAAELWGGEPKQEAPAPDEALAEEAESIESDDDGADDDDATPTHVETRKLSPLERVKQSKEKHKARADDAEREAMLLRAENKKYQEALDAIIAGKNKTKEEPEEKEYLDDELARDTDARLTKQDKMIKEAEYKIHVASTITQLDNPKEYAQATDALVVRIMHDTLGKIALEKGQVFDIATLPEDDFNELTKYSVNQLESIRRTQFSQGVDPVAYTLNTAKRLGLTNKQVDKNDNPAILNIGRLDSARKSSGKPEIARADVNIVGGGSYSSKDAAKELWG